MASNGGGNGGGEPQDKRTVEQLLEDVLRDPSEILNANLSTEQLLALQRKMNPYAYVAGNDMPQGHKHIAAISYTNLREEHLRNYVMTSLVGFLFQVQREWEVPTAARRWTPSRKKNAEQHATVRAPFAPKQLVHLCRKVTEFAEEADKIATRAEDLALEANNLEFGGADAAAVAEKRKEAAEAQAQAHGALYGATRLLYRAGQDADRRLDETEDLAARHPVLADMIAKDPIGDVRVPPTQLEVPQEVAQNIVRTFLRTWFEFDPNAHVRGAYDEVVVAEALADGPAGPVDSGDPERLPLEVLRAPAAAPAPEDASALEILTETPAARRALHTALHDPVVAEALARAAGTAEARDRFRRYTMPVPAGSPARAAVDVVPPRDTFFRWKFYCDVNYEALQDAAASIYHTKPDLEATVAFWDAWKGTDDEVRKAFDDFKNKHQDEFISSIIALDKGGWTMMSSVKQNRERVDFFNRRTVALQRIMDAHAEGEKLGAEMMRNSVRQKKAQNIREQGPDAAGLKSYKSGANQLAGMGAEQVISPEDMRRLERAQGDLAAARELEVFEQHENRARELEDAAKRRRLLPEEQEALDDARRNMALCREMMAVPDDAVQVDVFTHDAKTGTMTKKKFFTKADDRDQVIETQREAARANGKGKEPA